MSVVCRRIARLERQLGGTEGKPQILAVVCQPGTAPAAMASSIQVLHESGVLSTGPLGLVDLCRIPSYVNTESFPRERGGEICFPRRAAPGALPRRCGSADQERW
jgi:hypothetical protein